MLKLWHYIAIALFLAGLIAVMMLQADPAAAAFDCESSASNLPR